MQNSKRNLRYLIAIFCIFAFVFYNFLKQSNLFKSNSKRFLKTAEQLKCEIEYKQKCLKLVKRLRFPNATFVFSPPTKFLPSQELIDQFTQHGQMPIKKYSYINEAFDNTNKFFQYMQTHFKASDIEKVYDYLKYKFLMSCFNNIFPERITL